MEENLFIGKNNKGIVWVVIQPRNWRWYNLFMKRLFAKEQAKVAARCTAVSEQDSNAQSAEVAGDRLSSDMQSHLLGYIVHLCATP